MSIALVVGLSLAALTCKRHQSAKPEPVGYHTLSGSRPVDPGGDDDGQWTMPAKDVQNTRFSRLDQITTQNAGSLVPKFTFETGIHRGHEEAPLVVGKTLYLVTPFPNKLFAIDLESALAAGPNGDVKPKWVFDPHADPAAKGVACCDVVNRGVVYSEGKLFYNTLDAHTIAVDAETGQQVWNTKVGEISQGESMTMAPLVVKGKVLVGNSGGEFGIRGWLTALDAATGNIAWRAYHTGPDADCLIGPAFHPFYDSEKGKDLGLHSWPPDKWKIGGAGAWGWVSYDPDLDLVYYGTANPGPWNPEQRVGDNKWSAGIFARKPDTGEAVWFYQYSPHDLHDYDAVNESIVTDLEKDGVKRKVLLHAERTGYVFVFDRATGEVLSATPFDHITTSHGFDPKTGKILFDEGKATGTGKTIHDICPASPGAKDWQPAAWSPKTGLLYIPHQHLCQEEEGTEANYIAGTPFVGANVKMYPGPGGYRGVFRAWDPVAAKSRWEIHESFPVWSGAMVTAGNVAFYGTMDGWFKAVDATNGNVLWSYKLDAGTVGQPVTFKGPDGKQYVAIPSGPGGWAGAIVAADLDARDDTAALGFVNAMKDLPKATKKGGRLWVFGLP
jgi:lanthanide-dependent methanol dehydrogenase